MKWRDRQHEAKKEILQDMVHDELHFAPIIGFDSGGKKWWTSGR